MKTARLQTQTWALFSVLACALSACESRDAALQQELSELRESARAAKEEAEAAKAKLAKAQLLDGDALQSSLIARIDSFKKELPSLFPGYRVGSVEPGEVYYVFSDTREPYRSRLKVSMQGGGSAALTPELPTLFIEARADAGGAWSLPDQSKLREIQAAAMAKALDRASAQRPPQQSQRQPAPQQPSRPQPQPSDPNARVISWGDDPSPAPQADPAPQQPAPASPDGGGARRPNPNLPKADQSYEIRFD